MLFDHIDVFLMIGGAMSLHRIYRNHWLRYSSPKKLPLKIFRDPTHIKGIAAKVNDSDNVRFYHTPTLRWWSNRNCKSLKRNVMLKNTLNVRLAGIDAPECAYFGNPGQPMSGEAKLWLKQRIEGKVIEIVPHRVDQYERLVASVYAWDWWFLKRNVSLDMVKAGYACIYDGKGAEYGSVRMEKQLKGAEMKAKKKKIGIWKLKNFMSPKVYKRMVSK